MFEKALYSKGIEVRKATKNEIQICCPFCGDTRFRCFVNVDKGVFFCQNEECTGGLTRLATQLGINYGGETALTKSIKDLKEQAEKKRSEYTNTSQFLSFILLESKPFKKPLSKLGKIAYAYLRKRGFSNKQIKAYSLRYSDQGKYKGRIIIPIYENKKLVYFQARLFIPAPTEPKILNPPKEYQHGKNTWLFNYDAVKNNKTIIVCEGWASAISCGNSAIALQGSYCSDIQYNKIVKLPAKNIILVFDPDAHLKMLNVAEKLYKKGKEVYMVYLTEGDPNDLRDSIKDIIKNKRVKYDQLSKIKYKLKNK